MDAYSYSAYKPDYSKYFYHAKCEFDYIEGCNKANDVESSACPDFETCFLPRTPGLTLIAPLSDGNTKGSTGVSLV